MRTVPATAKAICYRTFDITVNRFIVLITMQKIHKRNVTHSTDTIIQTQGTFYHRLFVTNGERNT